MENGEGILLTEFNVLASEEEEVVVVLGGTQPAVGAGSGAGAVAFMVLFLDATVALGRKVDKVDKDSVNVVLHREEKCGAAEGRVLYNQMYSTKEY